MLTTSLVKCLWAVADTCHASVLETAFPGQLFASLDQLLLIREPSTQLDVALLWHRLVDHHANKDKIPLNTYVDVCVCVYLAMFSVHLRHTIFYLLVTQVHMSFCLSFHYMYVRCSACTCIYTLPLCSDWVSLEGVV